MRKLNLMIVFIGICMISMAQQNNGITPYFQNGMYSFNSMQKIELHNFFTNYRSDLGTTTNDSFAVQYINYLEDKKFDCRYLQYHKGYLVDGSSFLLHGESNLVLYAAGNQIKNLNVNISSPISESAALTALLTHLSSYTFDWQVDSIVNGHKEMYDDSSYSLFPKGSLVISKLRDSSWEANNFKLTWKFQVNIVSPIDSSITVYVDALTGNIYNTFDRSDYATYGTGTVQTIYNGTQNFRTWRCTLCSKWTLNSDVGGYYSIASFQGENGVLKDADNNWSDYTEQNTTTVHWATERAYTYFHDRHGRAGSNNKGAFLKNYCNITGLRYAGYRSEGDKDVIGVGERVGGVSPATLDILSHEYAHAFIRRNPNLNMYKEDRESGALNEGFADVFGILSERYTVGSTSWLIGEEVSSSYGNPSIRNFCDPHLSSLNAGVGQPAKYQETTYWDFSNKNMHKNAGVLTHWFYLLSQGGTYNGVTVPGVGIEKADDIAFITMMWWMWSSINFDETRNQSIAATIAHWGKCSKEHKAVLYAWAAVGLGTTALPECGWYRITGSRVINTTELTQKPVKFKLFNTDNESPIESEKINWQIPSGWNTSLSQDKNELTLNSVSNMDSKELKVVINNNNSYDTLKHIVHFVEYIDTANNDNPDAFLRKTNEQNPLTSQSDVTFVIYPNPAKDFVNIYIGNETEARLEIYSITGMKVSTEHLKSSVSAINISNLIPGSYIFKIISAKNQQTIHFSINH